MHVRHRVGLRIWCESEKSASRRFALVNPLARYTASRIPAFGRRCGAGLAVTATCSIKTRLGYAWAVRIYLTQRRKKYARNGKKYLQGTTALVECDQCAPVFFSLHWIAHLSSTAWAARSEYVTQKLQLAVRTRH